MNQTVPKLDLAPKLNRPLSLWNPLDYLLLLYWVFFFPQALRWYENEYGGKSLRELGTMPEKWQFLQQHPQQLQIWIQGILLTIITPYIISFSLDSLQQIDIDWFGMSRGLAGGVSGSVAFSVVFGVAFGVAEGVAFGVGLAVAFGVAFGASGGVTFSVAFGAAFLVAEGVALGVGLSVAGGVAGGVASYVVLDVAVDVAFGIGLNMASYVVLVVAGGVSIIRLENWLLGSFSSYYLQKQPGFLLPRITFLPLPALTSLLKHWLNQDWETGIYNLNQLLRYSLQFIPVVTAINQVLSTIPEEQLIDRVSQLAAYTDDWDLVHFCTVSVNNQMKVLRVLFFSIQKLFESVQPLLDIPSHAVAAGFWYLHEGKAVQAKEAFAQVRNLVYGEEMYVLTDILNQCFQAKDVSTIATLDVPTFPIEPYLRPTTWQTIKVLSQVIEDVQVIEKGTNRLTRSSALNRAIGQLQEIININNLEFHPQKLPEAERELIVQITETWQTALQNIAKDIGKIVITEPIPMPYVIGPPVEGQLFAGREDILRELKQLWAGGQNMQSVVLYGHRRMGKTSILKNINQLLADNFVLSFTNLQGLGDITSGVSEVLMAISYDIAKTLKIEPPQTEDLLNFPKIAFKSFLEDALATLPHQGLIIALDEFETLEELITKEKIPADFLGVFRTWTQISPRLGFVFAGLHTLEEKLGDYNQPFFASFIPMRVSFLDKASTYYLLTEPNQDFPLNYTSETLNRIYELTYGQPFLVQLIGFQMVSRYNKLLQQPTPPDNTLRLEDLDAVINEQFFQRGSYYFEGIWKQAREDILQQQEILIALAPHQEGLIKAELLQITGLNPQLFTEAIDTLKRHDVLIEEVQERLRIVVELFRVWLFKKQQENGKLLT